jgi:hypothetical protein
MKSLSFYNLLRKEVKEKTYRIRDVLHSEPIDMQTYEAMTKI